MFYLNRTLKKSVINAKVNFTNFAKSMDSEVDDALLPFKSAKISYNFNVKKGSLTNGYGFKDLTLPIANLTSERTIIPPSENIKKLWHYKYYDHTQNKPLHELLIFGESGQIYSCLLLATAPFTAPILNECVFSTAVPNAVNYRLNSEDYMIFSSESDGMWKYLQNHVVTEVDDSPFIKSMCLHYERLFAVVGGERNRLVFSANLDPTDWTAELSGGGFIDMQDERGQLSKVISYNDYVYVFRDFGVAKVSAYGDQTDFNVSQLFVSSVKLYGNTVTLCGNKVLLLARNGIHVFDGYSTTKLNLGIDSLFENVDNENASGLFYHNKFFLACKLNFNDGEQIGCESYSGGYTNNALIELDLSTNELSITRGVDISSLLDLDDGNFTKVVASFNGEYAGRLGELTTDGKLFGTVLQKKWLSPKSSMGYPTKVKHIKDCLIKSTSNCQVLIKTDKETKTFDVKGSEIAKRIKLNMIGEQLQVGFIVAEDGETNISCPQIELGVSG